MFEYLTWRSYNVPMFVDEAEIVLRGGHGGAGKISFYPPPMRGPDGGNGGRGGNLFMLITSDLTALKKFTVKKILAAEDGEAGGSNKKTGRDGEDLEIILPAGSMLTNLDTQEEIELNEPGSRILVCRGGLGGRGNFEFRSSRNTTPMFAQPGLIGEEKHFKVVLKLIADFGLVGLPNAGKSSLLNELTKSKAKTADYPFTTLEPNLGVMDGKILADIPGLIEGASQGKGLGIKFLKHIEKTSVLLHCIDSNSEDLLRDYQVVRGELKKYNPDLLNKPEIILLTKSDCLIPKEVEKKIKKLLGTKKQVYAVSIYDWESLRLLKQILI